MDRKNIVGEQKAEMYTIDLQIGVPTTIDLANLVPYRDFLSMYAGLEIQRPETINWHNLGFLPTQPHLIQVLH